MEIYDKTNWVDNRTIIDATKLNKIETQLELLTNSQSSTEENAIIVEEQLETITSNIGTLSEKVRGIDANTLQISELTNKVSYLTNNGDGVKVLHDDGVYKKIDININNLIVSDTITLDTNKVYRTIFSGSSVTFLLPNIENNNIFNQILIQATFERDIDINWGTSLSFGDNITRLPTGKYNLIWEYNGTNWVYGFIIIKGE